MESLDSLAVVCEPPLPNNRRSFFIYDFKFPARLIDQSINLDLQTMTILLVVAAEWRIDKFRRSLKVSQWFSRRSVIGITEGVEEVFKSLTRANSCTWGGSRQFTLS